MAMKATDLMIGDLVYIHEPECKGHRIDSIDELDGQVGADGEVYDECDIRPIPLTEEILEKNGFKKVNMTVDGDYRHYHLHGVCISWEEQSSFWYGEGDIEFKYVHELQHLLRLCGIEKEIEL
jgi:hypothetical protein